MSSWEETTSGLLRRLHLESIRGKLVAFGVIATLVPTVSTAWVSYLQNRRSLTAKVHQELESVSAQGARELDLWLKERVYDLRVFASSYVVSEMLDRASGGRGAGSEAGQRRLTDYLNSVGDRFPDYAALMVITPGGAVMGASARAQGVVAMPPAWQGSASAGEASLGPPSWDPALHAGVVVTAVPVQPGGRMLGALAARLRLDGARQILRRFAPGDSGRIFLVTAEGAPILTSEDEARDTGTTRLPADLLHRLSEHPGVAETYRHPDGLEVIGTLQQVPRPGWAVVAEIPVAVAYRQIHHTRNVALLLVTVLLLAVGLAAYGLGLLIVRPLDRLTQGASAVAGGDLKVDLPVVGAGEVGYLTQVFNDMVTRLRQSREELERLSVTDGLTGLWNRRNMMQRLSAEADRSRRAGLRFSVLMADVDHFKGYNDTHGHLAGDDVLTRVAAILRETVREADTAARYGGEEFLVLLTDTGMDGAVEVAQRVRARLAEESFAGGPVTVSVGVAAYPEYGETPEALIMSADVALYQAKKLGRDQVVRATPAPPEAARDRG